MKRKHIYWLTAAIAVASLFPLLLVKMETWDFVNKEMGYLRQDPFYFQSFKDHYYLRYLLLIWTGKISLLTSIPTKTITSLLAVASVLGIGRESFVLLRNTFRFDYAPAIVGAWLVLAFPVWHTLVSGAVLSYIVLLWIFLASVNQWQKKRRILAACLFIVSLSYHSLFALVVGFACCDFVLTVNRPNARRKILSIMAFGAVMLAWFTVVYLYGDIRSSGTDNNFNFDRLRSFLNYGIMACVIGAGAFFTATRISDPQRRETFIRRVLCLLILGFFSGVAYWAVGKPMRFFAFGSYTARHTYLTCIPFALGAAMAVDLALQKFSARAVSSGVAFVLVALLVLQHQGMSHKAAELIYRDVLTQEFEKTDAPPSGYVAVFPVGFKQPRHVHEIGLAMSMYRAYGRTAWMLNDPFKRHIVPTPDKMVAMYKNYSPDIMKGALGDEVSGDAYTKYDLHLDGFHQEGRFWYWWYYAVGDYSAFNPRLVKDDAKSTRSVRSLGLTGWNS
ncbi:MAG: hypothetical protein H0S80_15175 [Desulfovibrionaceae bacterium]|nr:hypothetical protein [Desulfovibrionaceae bacterium]